MILLFDRLRHKSPLLIAVLAPRGACFPCRCANGDVLSLPRRSCAMTGLMYFCNEYDYQLVWRQVASGFDLIDRMMDHPACGRALGSIGIRWFAMAVFKLILSRRSSLFHQYSYSRCRLVYWYLLIRMPPLGSSYAWPSDSSSSMSLNRFSSFL
jgi:hypothetical protein